MPDSEQPPRDPGAPPATPASPAAGPPPPPAGPAAPARSAAAELETVLGRLHATLDDAAGLLAGVERADAAAAVDGGPLELAARIESMQRRLEAADADRRELSRRLVSAERRGQRLTTLYVATYHLHHRLEPGAVETAIAEIASDLLGADRFVLLLGTARDGRHEHRVAMHRPANLPPGEIDPLFAGGLYRGGDPMVDATLGDGVLRQATEGDAGFTRAKAAVPLNVEGRTIGGLIVVGLLPHKAKLTAGDRDLLELLSAHAALALLSAELVGRRQRRLRSFQSLVELARGR